MKNYKALIFIALFMIQGYAFAGSDARKEAETLLNTMKAGAAMERSIEKILDLQLEQNPALTPYKQVMLKFLKKYMSYESLKPDMVAIYADAFTASELREINAFYKTPTGAKTIRLMPDLMAKGAQLGTKRVQDNMAELQQMIKDESERIKALQKD